MSRAMKAVLDVLAALGELEWARPVGDVDPLRPPLIAWRFKYADERITASILDAVRAYRGSVEWSMTRGDRNCVIEPAPFKRYAADFRVDVDALSKFAAERPNDARAFLEDVPRFAEHLRRSLMPH